MVLTDHNSPESLPECGGGSTACLYLHYHWASHWTKVCLALLRDIKLEDTNGMLSWSSDSEVFVSAGMKKWQHWSFERGCLNCVDILLSLTLTAFAESGWSRKVIPVCCLLHYPRPATWRSRCAGLYLWWEQDWLETVKWWLNPWKGTSRGQSYCLLKKEMDKIAANNLTYPNGVFVESHPDWLTTILQFPVVIYKLQ